MTASFANRGRFMELIEIGKVVGTHGIKGEVKICTLYLPEASTLPESCTHTLPFTEILDAEGVLEGTRRKRL